MKTDSHFFKTSLIFITIAIALISCEDKIVETKVYKTNIPQYMSLEELRSPVKISGEIPMLNPGKIYFKDNYIFINEKYKGVHVYNNKDPKNPKEITFIHIPGNVDIAIKDNSLYADSYIDLVVIDITDINNAKETDRMKNVFEQYWPSTFNDYPYYEIDPSKGCIVGWEVEEVKEEIATQRIVNYYPNLDKVETCMDYAAPSSIEATINLTGKSGSMAKFKIYKNYLYAIADGNWSLQVFDITNVTSPEKGELVHTNANIETLFLAKNKLFIGSTTGMLIYSLDNPALPEYYSSLLHVNSCDPVVVEGNTAYVTLRSGTACNGITNQLDVIDVSNLKNPSLIKSYPMSNPHGLGIDNNMLFICDGNAGLKIYDATDPDKISANMIKHFPEINAFDVIPLSGVLLLIGSEGFYQYSYKNTNEISLLSTIKIDRD